MAKVGLLSDSHGRTAMTQQAIRLLIDQGAELLLHLGDLCGEQVLDAMVESVDGHGRLDPPVHIVFGNCDTDTADLAAYAEHLGIEVDDPVGLMTFGDKRLVFVHGHNEFDMNQAIDNGVDYLCHGHTHQSKDERIGSTRVINPGALCRARQYTVALLDTDRDEVTFYPIGST